MRQVEILTPGQYITLDDPSAERLERLMDKADNGIIEDIHRFTLCFESARMGVFWMPGVYWKREFEKRLGPFLKACDIRLEVGTAGGSSQWERENAPPLKTKAKRRG